MLFFLFNVISGRLPSERFSVVIVENDFQLLFFNCLSMAKGLGLGCLQTFFYCHLVNDFYFLGERFSSVFLVSIFQLSF